MRALVCAALVAALAGCEDGQAPMGFLDGVVPQDDGPAAVRSAVLAQSVRVTAPSGYCVDPDSRRNGLGGNFVVLAPCAALGVAGIGWPKVVSVMTVSATRQALPAASAAELEAFVTSDEGRSLLSTSGQSGVDILSTETRQGTFLVQVREGGPPVGALEQTYWRGLVAAGGRLVSLTVRGYQAEPLSPRAGLALIEQLAADIRRASAPPVAENTAEPDQDKPDA